MPMALLLARVSGFFAVAPVFGWNTVPARIRIGLTLLLTIFFAKNNLVPVLGQVHWLTGAIMIAEGIICGAALGLAARLAYAGIQQGAQIIARQTGMMMANIVDPTSGERSQPIAILYETSFMLLFLAAGGHHLMLRLLAGSYDVIPPGGPINVPALTEAVILGGQTMLMLALRLSAPALAAFLILGVLLGILARVVPEMNILMASFPLRVGLGLLLAAAILPSLDGFTAELADWMGRLLIL